ncbi:hypothetical protein SBA2_280003 [Acidobacteriia bacterium SbA2]|nr:hypothetical protein SBA2_280003 [Acidobacteriia bacterium SbA2]
MNSGLRWSFEVDGTPATGRAADAAHGLIGVVVVVIDGQFFAFANGAQAHVDNVPLKNAGH